MLHYAHVHYYVVATCRCTSVSVIRGCVNKVTYKATYDTVDKDECKDLSVGGIFDVVGLTETSKIQLLLYVYHVTLVFMCLQASIEHVSGLYDVIYCYNI